MSILIRTQFLLLVGFALPFTSACQSVDQGPPGPVKVEIRQSGGTYTLYRGGEPYYIKGGGGGRDKIEKLAEHGGNSIRTWGTGGAQETLDRAQELGVTVTLGLNVTGERHGFDYDDEEAVAEQLNRVRLDVLRYKDHPALIIWAIGNELNLNAQNPKVWDAVNQISEMIHSIDPNHLTTTTLAGVNPQLIANLKERAPDLDLLAIQLYGGIVNLPRHVREIPIDRPYIVTEWGATGHWEVQETPWGAAIENNSSVKADAYLERYQTAIASDAEQCLGYYVFLWGQKQERTPTWYGVFLASGEETEAVDVMHYIWNGSWPENRTPRLESMRLDGREARQIIRLQAGQEYEAETIASDPDGDDLTYTWDLKHESTDLGEGGDFETTPESIPGLVNGQGDPRVVLTTPSAPGAYRLFVYVFDGNENAAHANIPFYVE